MGVAYPGYEACEAGLPLVLAAFQACGEGLATGGIDCCTGEGLVGGLGRLGAGMPVVIGMDGFLGEASLTRLGSAITGGDSLNIGVVGGLATLAGSLGIVVDSW